MVGTRVRNCVFTINNYDETCETMLKALYEEKSKYLIYGYEKGDSGTPHLQCYVELTQQLSFETLKKYLPRAHIETRKGTAQQAADYCKKEGDYRELGIISKQGKRSDLENVADDIVEGKSVRDVAIEYPSVFIKFHKGIKELRNQVSIARDWKPDVLWCYGTTGTGKTKHFYDNFKESIWVWSPHMGNWFDGYDGQANVLFDDYRGEFTYGMLLTILDRYECKVQVKGGMVQFKPYNIVITSPHHPKDIYFTLSQGDEIQQLLRRIDNIVKKT